MKKNQLIKLNNLLNSIKGTKGNVKFAYGVNKNIKLMANEIETLSDIEKSLGSENIDKYYQERMEIINKYAEKDENGNTIQSNEGQVRIVDIPSFQVEALELDEKYKAELDEYQNKINDFNKMIEEETDIKLFTMKLDHIPESLQLSAEEFEVLAFMIYEEDEEK